MAKRFTFQLDKKLITEAKVDLETVEEYLSTIKLSNYLTRLIISDLTGKQLSPTPPLLLNTTKQEHQEQIKEKTDEEKEIDGIKASEETINLLRSVSFDDEEE